MNHEIRWNQEFSIYATLLQKTTDHGFQQLFAAFCHREILQDVK